MGKTIEKIPNRNPKRQNCKPVLFEKWQPLIPMREPFVFNKFTKEDVAPNGAQSESDRIKNQPEDNVFCCYFGPFFLYYESDTYTISQILIFLHDRIKILKVTRLKSM